jgi:hypothetical protein
MALQFQDGFTRIRGGGRKPQRQALINHFATRIEKISKCRKTWLQRAADDTVDNARDVGA